MRLVCLIILTALLIFCCGDTARSQSSPFGVPGPGTGAQQAAPPAPAPPRRQQSLLQRAWLKILVVQRDLHRQLAGAVRALKRDGGIGAAWVLASLSFIYGVVHAIGPGHGKAVISSYVLANERTMRRGIALSFAASVVQALSAVALVGILAVIFNAAGLRIRDMAFQMESASYAMIALVGAWMLVSQLRRLVQGQQTHSHAHGHDHAHDDCGHAHLPEPNELEGGMDWRKAVAIILAVGIRPCTGAVIVLVFALANGLFLAGVAATFAMALGTAITVSALAVLAVGSRQLALRFAAGHDRWAQHIANVAAIGGSALVLVLGATLFIGSLGPARPF